MRLINTGTLRMREFFDDNVPAYIILYHTWGDEEITFQDWQIVEAFRDRETAKGSREYAPDSYAAKQQKRVETIKAKAGYRKVVGFCTQASKLRHHTPRRAQEWTWVDTVCISSSELSEAINAMFRWYQNSKLCMAYLSDVLLASESTKHHVNFENSRWFTRGWTLQELVAPKDLVFYDDDWAVIGNRGAERIRGILESTTGINLNLLPQVGRPESLSGPSVGERMSCASKRKTTRAEDIAYCLLGIFDVNMPLLYGEGGPLAFVRLQEETMKRTTDHTIFAWSYHAHGMPIRLSDYHGLLAPSPIYFSLGQSAALHDVDVPGKVPPF